MVKIGVRVLRCLQFANQISARATFFLLAVMVLPQISGAQAPFSQQTGNLANWFMAENCDCNTNNCSVSNITAKKGSNPLKGATDANFTGDVTYKDSIFNYNPGWSLSNRWMEFNRSTSPNFSQNTTVLIVFKTNFTGTSTGNWYTDPGVIAGQDDGSSSFNDCGINLVGNNMRWAQDGANAYTGNSGTVNNNKTFLLTFARQFNNGTGLRTYLQGTQIGGGGQAGNHQMNGNTKFYMGANRTVPASTRYDGEYAEVIMYSTNLSNTERNTVESYLALKYGITLSHDYLNASGGIIYNLDGVFDNDITGLGRHDNSFFHQRVSRTENDGKAMEMYKGVGYSGIFTDKNIPYPGIPVNNFANDNAYIVCGHDNGAVTFNSNLGNGTNNKLGRTFKIAESGTGTGPVTLVFRNSKYTDLTSGQQYYLAFGGDRGLGVGERFIPMQEIASTGNFYVEVDFPDNDTSYFTITKTNTFSGPANVVKKISLWYRSDTLVTGLTPITAWGDNSSNGRNATCSAAATNKITTPGDSLSNYHYVVKSTTLNRQFVASRVRGKTIIGVGKAINGQNDDGWLGFNPDQGLRSNNSNSIRNTGNANDWTTNVASNLRQDGSIVPVGTNASLNNWTIISGTRPIAAAFGPEDFYIGGYFNPNRTFDGYSFSEIIVYDSIYNTGAEIERLESYLAIKYGITLSHNYYLSDWNGTLGTTVYDVSTYGNNIAGIGRDDIGRLDQRQSRTNSKTSILSIAHGVHEVDNLSHDTLFAADKHFLVWGDDNGSVNCWSTVDAPMFGALGENYRIEREWKILKTGATWNNNFEVILNVDNTTTGMNIPPIPSFAVSPVYNLYLDDDGDFNNGSTTKIPMTNIAPGFWKCSMSRNLLPTGAVAYFTFGVEVDQNAIHFPSACQGDTIIISGSNLADNNICTMLTLQGSSTTVNIVRSGSFSPSTYKVLDKPGNCIDTLMYLVDMITPPPAGAYAVLVDTIQNSGAAPNCTVGSYGPPSGDYAALVDSANVANGGLANFSFITDTVCVSDTNIVAAGFAPGGFFTITGSSTNCSGNCIMPDDSNGVLLVHPGSLGDWTLTYHVGGSTCPSSHSETVTIVSDSVIDIGYMGLHFCESGPDRPMSLPPGVPSGGTFTSSPAGVVFSGTAGMIKLGNNTPPGTYTITYTPPAVVACMLPADTVVIIDSVDVARFDFLQDTVCSGDSLLVPLVSYHPATGSFSLIPPSPSTPISGSTGNVTLAGAPSGTYYVQYGGIAGSCVATAVDSFEVLSMVDASFTLPGGDSVFCPGAGLQLINPITTGGVLHCYTGSVQISGLGFNPAPPSQVGGPYELWYLAPHPYCPDSSSKNIYINGQQAAVLSYLDSTYCETEVDPLPYFQSGTPGGAFFSVPSTASLNAASGKMDLSSAGVGSFDVYYIVPDSVCPDTMPVGQIVIEASPNAQLVFTPLSVCENSGSHPMNTLNAGGGSGTLSIFSGNSQIVGGIAANMLDANVVPPGGPYLLRYISVLGNCSDTVADYVSITSQDYAGILFIPDTICAGDLDPTPLNLGTGGGYFWANLAANPNTQVDPVTGIVDVIASDTGMHVINYATVGICPDSTSDTLYIFEGLDARFTYPQYRYCTTDSSPVLPDTIINPLIGTFGYTSIPPGLVLPINTSTGSVDLNNSPEGTYYIKYTISRAGACADQYVQRLDIEVRDAGTQIAYADSSVCPSHTDITPLITGDDSTGFFTADVGLIFSDVTVGTISPSQSPPGSYHIYYQLFGSACNEIFEDSITIAPFDDAHYTYPGGDLIYCIGEPNITPVFFTPGDFSARPYAQGDFLSIVDSTGYIDLSRSDPGIYRIIHETFGTCPALDSTFALTVSPAPTGLNLDINPGTQICEGNWVEFTAIGGQYVALELNHTLIGVTTEFQLDNLVNNDSLVFTFYTIDLCESKDTVVMRVISLPSDSVLTTPSIVLGGQTVAIDVMAQSPQTSILWSSPNNGSLTFDIQQDTSDILDSGMVYTIENVPSLEDEFMQTTATYFVTPYSYGCPGATDTLSILINPNGKKIFVPQVITPNGDGKNDVWKIQWLPEVIPANYVAHVYNSAGGEVFTMEGLVSDWNGGGLPDGVYWYVIFDQEGKNEDSGGLTIRTK